MSKNKREIISTLEQVIKNEGTDKEFVIRPGQVWLYNAVPFVIVRITEEKIGDSIYQYFHYIPWQAGKWWEGYDYWAEKQEDGELASTGSDWNYYTLFNGTQAEFDENHRMAVEMMATGQKPFAFDMLGDGDDDAPGTELMGLNSKEFMLAKHEQLGKLSVRVANLNMAIKVEAEARKQELDRMLSQMTDAMTVLKKKMRRVMRVVDTLELYLGIQENIVQITEGEPAGIDEPITFRQQLVYMDEELAVHRYDADSDDLGYFDDWLLENERYKRYVPEERCIVAFKPRRFEKSYFPENPFLNAMYNDGNFDSYLLIRNGENLYRIWSDLHVGERLFPRSGELQEMLKGMQATWERDKDAAEEKLHGYQRLAFVLQGLMDRTQILQPMHPGIKIFELDRWEHLVRFVYDDENTLDDGRPSFKEWKVELNSNIEEGCRVLITGRVDPKEYKHRLFGGYRNEYSLPPTPARGIYTVELRKDYPWKEYGYYGRDVTATEVLYVLHNPGDEVTYSGNWDYDPHERKKRLGFIILPKDGFVFDYDQLTLDDVQYYLENRYERQNYINIIHHLLAMRDELQAEVKAEADFVKLTAYNVQQEMTQGKILRRLKLPPIEQIEQTVWECLRWWKVEKVKWRRALTSDDAKAWRMIKSEAKKRLKQ